MKLKSKLFYAYVASLVIYTAFTLLPAPSPLTLHRYHLSPTGVRLIDLTIILLYAGIWFAGFYGYAKLREYTELIKSDKDGQQINKLTHGVFILVIWTPITAIVSSIFNYAVLKNPQQHGLLSSTRIISNYLNLLLPLAAFVLISFGARGLTKLARKRPSLMPVHVITAFLVYVGLIYWRMVVTTPGRADIYHLSAWMILLTLVGPYVYMWSIGLMAAYELYTYQRKVAGIVYRKSWSYLALGLGWLIVTSIIFQYVTTATNRLLNFSIYWILLIVYSLLLILSAGFVLIAVGARKLRRIEEV